MSDQQPTLTPPSEEEMALEEEFSHPDDAILATMAAESDEAETAEAAEAPTEIAADVESEQAAGATTWHINKRVTHLWSINQNRNVYIALSGVGWRKLADNHDSCVVALNILAATAKLGNRVVRAREVNGKIVEMYVW